MQLLDLREALEIKRLESVRHGWGPRQGFLFLSKPLFSKLGKIDGKARLEM